LVHVYEIEGLRMKILHVWNQAGVGSILAKYQRKLGHEALVIKRRGFDKWGIERFYGTRIYDGSTLGFYWYVLRACRKVDVVHVHSIIKVVPFIDKPCVLHFHGSDLRKIAFVDAIFKRLLSVKVLVSTPDLLNLVPKAEWLPNPVDTELFYPHKPKEAPLKDTCELGVPYKLMSDYLVQYSIFWEDPKHSVRFPRKMAFEALACGLSVIWNGLTISPPLPKIHEPLNVAKRTVQIYEGLMN